jgi:CPA1 family monovalent cation:H+ antiporter
VAEVILISMALLTIAMLAAGLFKNFSIPYTVLLVAIGLALSELSLFWSFLLPLHEFKLTPDLVFFVFLPALIFESGLSLDARLLLKNLAPVLTLAVPALLISTTLVGFSVWLLLGIDLTVALLFGALISATDPVAVVALFKELGAPRRLNILVEGESLFNDATAIVVFGILLTMVLEGSSVTLMSTGAAVIEFFRVFIGGAVVGVLFGLLVSEMLFRLQSSTSAILTMSIVTAYGGFIIAEHSLHVSGVMATVSSAVTLSVYGLSRIASDIKSILAETWEFVGLIANSLLFLLVGLSINTVNLFSDLFIILVVVAFVQLARAASVYSLVPITIRLFKLPLISMAERHIMWWGGLKGGLAIAIVLSIPESLPGRDLLINLTLGVVLFTLMVNAWTIRPLMKKLKLDCLTDDEKIELEQGLKHAGQTSTEMLQSYVDLGIIQKKLSKKLSKKITSIFSSVSPVINDEQSWREVYLAALREEFHSVDKLYKVGLISQYTLLDIRNALQLDRDSFNVTKLQNDIESNVQPKSLFQRLEMWVLKEFREKNWAIVFLSNYQRKRLSQRIQRDIAGIVMTQAVIEMLSSRDDLDKQASRVISGVYQQRLDRWKLRLEALHNDFEQLFENIEKEIFTLSSLKTAQDKADFDFHHGEIGTKAHNKVTQTVNNLLNESANNGVEEQLSIKMILSIPLFSSLSEDVLKLLLVHVRPVTFLSGDIIIGEGEKGDALYIISHGEAEATKKLENRETKILGKLKQGDFFGEQALLGDHVRSATVTAKTAMTLLRLRQTDIIKFAEKHIEVKQRLEQARDDRATDNHVL